MTLRVDVLTLFPDAIANYASTSVLGRAGERDVWELHLHDLRDATDDAHRTVDDTPFGGGAGMVLRAEPILRTLDEHDDIARPLIALTPSGRAFTHVVAEGAVGVGGLLAALRSLRGHRSARAGPGGRRRGLDWRLRTRRW